MIPQGPFDLLNQNQFFNGWPTLDSDNETIVMAFPVEGWAGSAAVTLRQASDGSLDIVVHGTDEVEPAKQQALAAMSLDEDGSGWADVGRRDKVMGDLQARYKFLRPSLFHSPYEAAASFIIGHRISMVQGRRIRANLSQEFGEKIDVAGEVFFAFPGPQKLLALREYAGLSETKIDRLQAVARAALDGSLTRTHLRGLDDQAALAELESLPGVGPFFSQGILYRGAGNTDGFTHDDMTYHAIKAAYGLEKSAPKTQLLEIARSWQLFRMWAIVLLHIWARETGNTPAKRTFSQR